MLHQYCNVAGIWELLVGWDRGVMLLSVCLSLRWWKRWQLVLYIHTRSLPQCECRNAAWEGKATFNYLDYLMSCPEVVRMPTITFCLSFLYLHTPKGELDDIIYVDLWKWAASFVGKEQVESICYQDLFLKNLYSGLCFMTAYCSFAMLLSQTPRTHFATLFFCIFVNNLMTLYMFFFFPANSLGVGVGKFSNSHPMRVNL